MQQPPTQNPGVEPPIHIQPSLAASEPTYRHQTQITFPDLAKLAQAGRYVELATACENLEAAIPDEPDSHRLLVTGPLVLAHLINDDATSAYYALKRLPGPLAESDLPQALLPLTASIADRKYQNIQPRISTLISFARSPQAPLEPELALLVEYLSVALQATWKRRIAALLSRAYATIPTTQASALLHMPPDRIVSYFPSWKYNAVTGTLTPTGDVTTISVRSPSSISRFDDAVAGAAQLESAF